MSRFIYRIRNWRFVDDLFEEAHASGRRVCDRYRRFYASQGGARG